MISRGGGSVNFLWPDYFFPTNAEPDYFFPVDPKPDYFFSSKPKSDYFFLTASNHIQNYHMRTKNSGSRIFLKVKMPGRGRGD